MTLRRRLVLGILALLAAVIVVIGVLSVVALRGMLVDRLDEQLEAAVNRSQVGFDGGGPGPTFLPCRRCSRCPASPRARSGRSSATA